VGGWGLPWGWSRGLGGLVGSADPTGLGYCLLGILQI
jgi:hypothetical protein